MHIMQVNAQHGLGCRLQDFVTRSAQPKAQLLYGLTNIVALWTILSAQKSEKQVWRVDAHRMSGYRDPKTEHRVSGLCPR